jgi:hypothetical protein
MVDTYGKPRAPKTIISLPAALASLGVDARWRFHNAGNDALSCLLLLQMLIDGDNTKPPIPVIPQKGRSLEVNAFRTRTLSSGPTNLPTQNSLPVLSINASPPWGGGGNLLVSNEFGTLPRTLGRPNTFYGNGANLRSSSTGDLLSSTRNFRTS